MATSPCEGRAVALFDADAAAPCETSLAGIPLSARARVQTKCIEGDLAEVELMREDALASSRREGQPFETARLCARCADAYDVRRSSLGCEHCGQRLAATDLTSDLQDGVLRCGQCMLDAAVAAARTSALEQAAREAASPPPRPKGEPMGVDGRVPATDRVGNPLGVGAS